MKINQCKTEQEVIEWLMKKKKDLDKKVKYFLEKIHYKLSQYESKARERINTIDNTEKPQNE